MTGWETNLWDGRVEMEVQGQPLDIQELLKRIQEQNWIEVSDMEITDIPCEQENSFHIYWEVNGRNGYGAFLIEIFDVFYMFFNSGML